MAPGRVWVRWTGYDLVYIFTVLDVTVVYNTQHNAGSCDVRLVTTIYSEDTDGLIMVTMYDAPALSNMADLDIYDATWLTIDAATLQHLSVFTGHFDGSWRLFGLRDRRYNYYQPQQVGIESIADQIEQTISDQLW